jgi:hypothetical protein
MTLSTLSILMLLVCIQFVGSFGDTCFKFMKLSPCKPHDTTGPVGDNVRFIAAGRLVGDVYISADLGSPKSFVGLSFSKPRIEVKKGLFDYFQVR